MTKISAAPQLSSWQMRRPSRLPLCPLPSSRFCHPKVAEVSRVSSENGLAVIQSVHRKTNTPTNGGGGGDDAQIANFNIDPPSLTAAAAAMAGGRQVATVVAVVGQYLQNSAHSACARCQNSASSEIEGGASCLRRLESF